MTREIIFMFEEIRKKYLNNYLVNLVDRIDQTEMFFFQIQFLFLFLYNFSSDVFELKNF